MSKKLITILSVLVVVALLAGSGIALTRHFLRLPDTVSPQETLVLGQNRFNPGSRAALRVLVKDVTSHMPVEGAAVRAVLVAEDGSQQQVYTGVTDGGGNAAIEFDVPTGETQWRSIVVETTSELGSDRVERPISVNRDWRVLVTTDKPIYQPGQVIHLRALALSSFDLTPYAGRELGVSISDGQGNRVFRQTLTTSEFGAAWTDFQLASEVNNGNYSIEVSLGNATSKKTVRVEPYVLPKYKIAFTTDRDYYTPGEHVSGALQVDYFFGKPVDEARVRLEGYTFDFERQTVMTIEGVTGEDGSFPFEFDLPAYLAGSDLEGGQARFYLEASLVDQADHAEVGNYSIPVAQSGLVINAVPEGGKLRAGVDNIIYVMVSRPDGTPTPAELILNFYSTGEVFPFSTDDYGLAEVHITPPESWDYSFNVEATDASGQMASRDFYMISAGSWGDSILLRSEHPVYRVGETMNLTVLTTRPSGSVYVDIIREGQTMLTTSVELENGRALLPVDLSPDLFGTLQIHAYMLDGSGSILLDTRLVVVDPAADLQIDMNAEADEYRPGEMANLLLKVRPGENGAPVNEAALGLAIVDESVYALAELDPGFARLYFLLEEELMTPRYDLHGFSVPDLMAGPVDGSQELQAAVEVAAQAALSDAMLNGESSSSGVRAAGFAIRVNSRDEAVNKAYQAQWLFFEVMGYILAVLIFVVSLTVTVINMIWVGRQRKLWKSLLISLMLIAGSVLFQYSVPPPNGIFWDDSLGSRLMTWINWFSYSSETVSFVLAVLSLLALIVLLVSAIRSKDGPLGWWLAGGPVIVGLLLILIMAWDHGSSSPTPWLMIPMVLGLLLLPVTLLVRSSASIMTKRLPAGVAGLLLAIFMLPTVVSITSFGYYTSQPDMLVEERALAEMAVPAAGMAMPTQTVKGDWANTGADGSITGASAGEPPRLRQYFPETLYWLPDGVTDAQGELALEIPMADSITTWRVSALASTADGRMGSATGALRVFQDFFIDLDLPLALTVGDDVSIPVGVFNYLEQPQTVRLELQPADWFEPLQDLEQEMEIGANDISVVYFPIRVTGFGSQPFQVTAYGSRMSDAVRKMVNVYPQGKQFSFTQSDRLAAGSLAVPVSLPAETVAGTQTLQVKVYPSMVAQVVEGLESILRMPNGCFEQTSSSTYPNVLVMDYLKSTGQISPEVQMKAEQYINLGYQRLLTFEVDGSGGFSLFGDAPADRMLTAYGLQEFADMSQVHAVDERLIERAAEWLLSQQQSNGTWQNDQGLVHEDSLSSLGDDPLPVTAYVTWSLVQAGYGDDARLEKSLAYIRENAGKARDPYAAALVANALVSVDLLDGKMSQPTLAALDRLAGMAQLEDGTYFWPSDLATFTGASGATGSIETTALAALAFIRSGENPEIANASLAYLVRQKDSYGTWYSTQATVLTLKALIESVRGNADDTNAVVTVRLNDGQERSVTVNAENYDVVQVVTFDDINLGRENRVEIEMEGEGELMYQVAGSYYLPYKALPLYPDLQPLIQPVEIQVDYDRTQLAVNDSVTVDVLVNLLPEGSSAESAMVDLGLPPGFTVSTEDLDALVARFNDVPEDYAFPKIERYELTPRQVLVYITDLRQGTPLEFSYRMTARFPLRAQAPASTVYDYYNPDVSGDSEPLLVEVSGGE